MALLKSKDRALLVVDIVELLILLFEVEDLVDDRGDVTILLGLFRPCLCSNGLPDHRMLQAARSHMRGDVIILSIDLLLWNGNDLLRCELTLLVYT